MNFCQRQHYLTSGSSVQCPLPQGSVIQKILLQVQVQVPWITDSITDPITGAIKGSFQSKL